MILNSYNPVFMDNISISELLRGIFNNKIEPCNFMDIPEGGWSRLAYPLKSVGSQGQWFLTRTKPCSSLLRNRSI